jgi:hypothetical protein
MQPLPCVGASKRALVTALALALELGLATLGLPCTAGAQDASPTADAAPLANVCALDDSVLASQRGGRNDMATVTAIPEISAGLLSVTLWDELARPAPAPRPVDTGGTTQFNAISYTRK